VNRRAEARAAEPLEAGVHDSPRALADDELDGPCGLADDPRARRVELVISMVLRVGVTASLAVIVGGLVADLVRHPAYTTSTRAARRLVSTAAHYPHGFGTIFAGVAHGDTVAIVMLGLMMLVATPVTRVAVSILTFVYERNALFVAVTTFVLVVLVGSFALGKIGG
jgi:uncharacterized membrane protein